jgi:succinyl-CoA synthetase beta subunit
MKLREYEAKNVIKEAGIPVPAGFLIRSPDELTPHLDTLGETFMLKAQVDVGGRGKAGGILMAGKADGAKMAQELFGRQIKGLPVKEILAEQRLDVQHEYYLSITVDRSSKQPLILFTEAGGVDIEITAKEHPEAMRKAIANPLMRDIPPFMLRELIGTAPKEIGLIINKLYRIFIEKDAILAEINPLVITPHGVFAADAKLIIDDNALGRQGFRINRDFTDREREAEKHGFSYVELNGTIGVIGNGAGLTMSTLDLIEFYGGKAANFLDVGGGANKTTVSNGFKIILSDPNVKAILINIFGGIVRCDRVAEGVIDAAKEMHIHVPIVVRLEGTNAKEAGVLLNESGLNFEVASSLKEAAEKVTSILSN